MAKDTIPVVGMGATRYSGSDRYPFTIIKVVSPTTIVVQEDDAKLVSGSCQTENQEYEYTPNTDSREITLTKRKNGRWYEKGESMKGTPYSIGTRDRHYDPCF